MFRRRVVILILLCLLPFVSTFAQGDVPQQVLDAVNLLSQRFGTTLSIYDMAQWSYDIQVFDSSSLGCTNRPSGTPGSYLAYIVSLRYAGTTYDIRVSSDRSIAFICGSNATPTPSFCDGGQTPRMIIGSAGRVTLGGLPNALRVQPNPTAGAVAEIPAGGEFLVLEGPRCGSGYTWWQVDYNGAVGWTPEGDATTYWIEPLDALASTATPTSRAVMFATNTPVLTPSLTPTTIPTATVTPTVLTATPVITAIVPSTSIASNVIPAPTSAACPAVSTHLAVGQQARVTLGGLPNNVRAQAGTSGAYLGEIPPGGVFNVLAGPTCTSEYTWWQVDYNGLVGWTPEGDYPNFWLEPVIPQREAFSGANINRVALREEDAWNTFNLLGDISFSADSSFMISSYPEMTIRLDTASLIGNVILMDTPAYFAFNPTDVSVVAVLDVNGRAYTIADQDGDIPLETDLFTVPDYEQVSKVVGVAWSNDNLLFVLQRGGVLEVWNGLMGEQVATLSAGSVVTAAFLNDDASGVYYGGDDGSLYYWNADNYQTQLVRSFNAPIYHIERWQSSLAVVYSERLNVAVQMFDINTNVELYYGRFAEDAQIADIALTHDVLAVALTNATGSAVGLWDTTTGTQVWLPDQTQPVTEMRFSPDGTILAIGSLDNAIRLWGIAAP